MTVELGRRDSFQRAAERVRQAIELLDSAGAPSDIAAHLDLALSRIENLAGLPATGQDAFADSANHGQSEPN
jgi:hypothetical protein